MAKISYRSDIVRLKRLLASCILLVGAAHPRVHEGPRVVVPHDSAPAYVFFHTSARSRTSASPATSHHSIWLPGCMRSHMLGAAHLTQLRSSRNHACGSLVTALLCGPAS